MSGSAHATCTNQSPIHSINKISDVADCLPRRNAIRRWVKIVFYDTERKMADGSGLFGIAGLQDYGPGAGKGTA